MKQRLHTSVLILLLGLWASAQAEERKTQKVAQSATVVKPTAVSPVVPTENDTPSAVDTKGPRRESVRMSAGIQMNMLAVSDDDPANDRVLLYTLSASVDLPLKGLTVGINAGFAERFVIEEGDSSFRLNDSAMSVRYSHAHLAKKRLSLNHGITAWLPTSRTSLNRELRVAPSLTSQATYRIIGPLSVRHQIQGQYRWYRYAEVPNNLAMNTQWILSDGLGLVLKALDSPTFGQLTVSMGAGIQWSRKYASQDSHTTALADSALWNQSYRWNVGFQYRPIKWVGLNASLQHGSPLRRNGIINPFFVHRDMTEIALGVTGYY